MPDNHEEAAMPGEDQPYSPLHGQQPLNEGYVAYIARRFWTLVEETIRDPKPWPWLKLMGTVIVLAGLYWLMSG